METFSALGGLDVPDERAPRSLFPIVNLLLPVNFVAGKFRFFFSVRKHRVCESTCIYNMTIHGGGRVGILRSAFSRVRWRFLQVSLIEEVLFCKTQQKICNILL